MIKSKLYLICLTLCLNNFIKTTSLNNTNNKRKRNVSSSVEYKDHKRVKTIDTIKDTIKKYVKSIKYTNFIQDSYFNCDDQVWLYQAIKNNNITQAANIILSYEIELNPIVLALIDNDIKAANFFTSYINNDSLKNYFKGPNFNQMIVKAIKDGNISIIEFFINLNININDISITLPAKYNWEDPVQVSLARWAVINGQLKILELLLPTTNFINENVNTYLVDACSKGHLDLVKYLIETQKPDVNYNLEEYGNNTPLVNAAENGHLEIVKYLVENGAYLNNPNYKEEDYMQTDKPGYLSESLNNYEKTPLMLAVRNNHIEIVKYLVERGSSINTMDDEGYTALCFAVENGNLEIIEYLVNNGAYINMYGIGHNVLTIAIEKGYNDIFNFLVNQKNVDVEVLDISGWTALALAIKHNRPDIVKTLVKFGADVNNVFYDESEELTSAPIAIACSKYSEADSGIIKFLITSGANISYKEENGNEERTALDLAKEYKDEQVQLILEIEESLLNLKENNDQLAEVVQKLITDKIDPNKEKEIKEKLDFIKKSLLVKFEKLSREHYAWFIDRIIKHYNSSLILELKKILPLNLTKIIDTYVELKSNNLDESKIKNVIREFKSKDLTGKNSSLNKIFLNRLLKVYWLKKANIHTTSNILEFLY